MDNRVYYGEYSLKHWIDMVLKKNIILPDYQRYFVWDEKKVETLINTFKNKQFVPPVTIGAFKIAGSNENLLLDGQQRLTSILLAYLGLYPDVKIYKKAIETFANDNDDLEEDIQLDNILEWNINILTSKGKSKEAITREVIPENYKIINLDIDDSFLEENFLGFSYLVPQTLDENEQQKYYSSVFRNINIQGEPLLPQESRASLYFLDQDLVDLFSPSFCKHIVIKVISNEAKIDFVRYLSLLSQYHKNGDASRVARSYKPKMEKYYEEYIYSAISGENSETYGSFLSVFPNKEYEEDILKLEEALETLSLYGTYSSIIDVDTYLFGLVYHIIFKKRKISPDNKDDLKDRLDRKIDEFKKEFAHQKSPNNLGHLRNRISQSISIYERFVVNEPQ